MLVLSDKTNIEKNSPLQCPLVLVGLRWLIPCNRDKCFQCKPNCPLPSPDKCTSAAQVQLKVGHHTRDKCRASNASFKLHEVAQLTTITNRSRVSNLNLNPPPSDTWQQVESKSNTGLNMYQTHVTNTQYIAAPIQWVQLIKSKICICYRIHLCCVIISDHILSNFMNLLQISNGTRGSDGRASVS